MRRKINRKQEENNYKHTQTNMDINKQSTDNNGAFPRKNNFSVAFIMSDTITPAAETNKKLKVSVSPNNNDLLNTSSMSSSSQNSSNNINKNLNKKQKNTFKNDNKNYGYDQILLEKIIYPLFINEAFIHDEYTYLSSNSKSFPTHMINDSFIGQVIENNNMPNCIHQKILQEYKRHLILRLKLKLITLFKRIFKNLSLAKNKIIN